jgi:bifunctional non-homologous end joining protein LigD
MGARPDSLREYRAKRDFARTPEPKGARRRPGRRLRYLIQKHDARRLHYDLRLEWNGALMSWAVPKGPSESPRDKRLAIHVEDHPIEYGTFEGTIPKGEYGGGTVMLWDRGSWEPHGDVDEAMEKGKLSFELHGTRLQGNWALVRLRARKKGDKDNWLLIKEQDDLARTNGKLAVDSETTSVKSGREMDEIAQSKKVWRSNRNDGEASRDNGHGPVSAATKTNRKSGKIPLPAFVEPQLATLVDAPPPGPEWLHEIKYDGYRAIASTANGKVVIRTRNGLDWTNRFHPLIAPLAQLPCDSAVLDGEIAVADAEGHTNFGALQNALSNSKGGFSYYVFDLLHCDGEDLRGMPLAERKDKLKALLRGAPGRGLLVYSDHVRGSGDKVFAQACNLKLEGIVSKQADAPYRSGRTKSWLKSKCGMEQEFVIIGWRPSTKRSRPFSSILLAVRDEGELRYAGRVGSGYSDARLEGLAEAFSKLARKGSPAQGVPPAIARQARFLEPKLVAEIAFRGWTRDGLVRQGSFKGLRSDKPASEIVRERTMPTADAIRGAKRESAKARDDRRSRGVITRSKNDAEEIEGVRVTHPDRVLFAAQGVTKRELIRHYVSVADRMLPYIANRPISLVRCPRGSGQECFFQKHASDGFPAEFKAVRITEKSGTADYLYITDVRGLVASVQMGVLELHIWGCKVDDVEKPDRMIFDFDPDEGLAFAKVRDAAREMRERLEQVGLQSYPMVTGGKGVHVVVPLRTGHSWNEHREFAEAMARTMAADSPDLYVANMSKAKRRGKIYVDYLRNQRGATAIAPYSTRARADAYVALPVSWTQLSRLKDAHPAHVGELARFIRGRDPWAGYHQSKQRLPKLK